MGPKKNNTRIVTKEVVPKIQPTIASKLTVISDPKVGDYLRIILTKPGSTTDYVIHRPIGKTDLGKEDWVLSDPTELAQLVARKDDPAKERRQADLNSVVHAACLNLTEVVETSDGVLEYADAARIGTRSDFLNLIKETRKNADSTWNRSHWLAASSDARAGVELLLDRTKATSTASWEIANPDVYRTRSGARMNTDQEGLVWAHAKTLTQIEDSLREAIVNGPDPVIQITGYANTLSNLAVAPGSSTVPPKTGGTVIDLSVLATKDRKDVKYFMKRIHEVLGEPNGTYVLALAPPSTP